MAPSLYLNFFPICHKLVRSPNPKRKSGVNLRAVLESLVTMADAVKEYRGHLARVWGRRGSGETPKLRWNTTGLSRVTLDACVRRRAGDGPARPALRRRALTPLQHHPRPQRRHGQLSHRHHRHGRPGPRHQGLRRRRTHRLYHHRIPPDLHQRQPRTRLAVTLPHRNQRAARECILTPPVATTDGSTGGRPRLRERAIVCPRLPTGRPIDPATSYLRNACCPAARPGLPSPNRKS